jgi:pyridoxamine 5'-phosphate oxidase family protein
VAARERAHLTSADATAIEITGINFAATKKFRDVARTHRAAIVIDDVQPPWRPRGIEIRGHAEAIEGAKPRIRIRPERIVAWGIEGPEGCRTVGVGPAAVSAPCGCPWSRRLARS